MLWWILNFVDIWFINEICFNENNEIGISVKICENKNFF